MQPECSQALCIQAAWGTVAAALIRLSLRRNSIPLGSASPHLKSLKGEPSPGTTPPLPLGSSAGLVLDTHRK